LSVRRFRQSEPEATLRRVFFVVVDSDTGKVLQTGKAGSLDGYVSKKGALPIAVVGSFTEVDATNQPGLYYYEATIGELDTIGRLVFRFTCTDCVERTIVTHVGTTNEDLDSELDAVALEANVQGHAAAALTAYDPPTRAEATADKDAILADLATRALQATVDLIKAETDNIGAIPGDVLEESITAHKAVANSLAAAIQLLRRRTIGRAVRDDDYFTIYDDDGLTVLAKIPVSETEYGPPVEEA
jgi:hypothetical protein